MALLIPFLFIVSVSEILALLLNGQYPFSMIFYGLLFLAGLEETVVGNIMFKEKVGGIERLREVVYLLLTAALILFLMQPGSLNDRIGALQYWQSIYMGICLLLQWFLTYRIHANLRDREILLVALSDKKGDELKLALRSSSSMANLTLLSVRRVKRLIVVLQCLIFVLLLILFFLEREVGNPLLVVLMIHGMLGMLSTFILSNAIQDQLLFGEGIFMDEGTHRKRFFYAFVVLIIVLFLVFVLSRRTSLFPLSFFQPFLDWLAGLFSGESRAAPSLPRATRVPQRSFAEMLSGLDQGPTALTELLRLIMALLAKVIVICLGLLFLYFLLSPLLSDYFRRKLKGLHPLKVIWSRVQALVSLLLRLIDALLAWLRNPFRWGGRIAKTKNPAKDVQKWRRRKLEKPGLLKRWEMGRVLKAFLKLVRYGRRRGVTHLPHNAPVEYAALVAEAVPLQRSAITEAMTIFEEVLFSPYLLSRAKLSRYFGLINSIVKGKAVR